MTENYSVIYLDMDTGNKLYLEKALGSGIAQFKYIQNTPASTWTLYHKQRSDKFVITIRGADNQEIVPDNVSVFNLDTIAIQFSQPVVGSAILVIFDQNPVTPSPTPTPTLTATMTVTPSLTATPSVTASVTPTLTASLTPSITASVTPSITSSATITPTVTATASLTMTPTNTASATVTPTLTVSPSVSSSAGVTSTPTPTVTGTPEVTPTSTPTPTASATITPTLTITPTTTVTGTPSSTVTPTATVSVSPTETPPVTPTMTASVTASAGVTATPTPTVTQTISITPSVTISISADVTPTPTTTVTPSVTGSAAVTVTPTPTITQTVTASVTGTPAVTPTSTVTGTPPVTPTMTQTVTGTPVVSPTPSVTGTPPVTQTATPTVTATPPVTVTPTISITPTISVTPSITQTITPTHTPTPTPRFDQVLMMDNAGTPITSSYHQIDNVADVMCKTVDGKVYVGGKFNTIGGSAYKSLARLNSDGTLDTGFTPVITTNNSSGVLTICQTADGKIYVAGALVTAGGTTTSLFRLNSDGTYDSTFSASTYFLSGTIQTIMQASNGLIYVGGFFSFAGNTHPQKNLMRLSSSGVLDTAYTPAIDTNASVYTMLESTAAGYIFVAGIIAAFNSVTVKNMVAIDSTTGAYVTTYTSPAFNERVLKLILTSTNSIYASGLFSSIDGGTTVCRSIARMDQFGVVDSSFTPFTIFTDSVENLLEVASGKIYFINSQFQIASGVTQYHMGRLNSDGTLDTAYRPPFVTTVIGNSGLVEYTSGGNIGSVGVI